ncbi:MAG: permease [Planctomycetota bacterium]|nr:MAG: permease [Planctomycetota bacterium]
MKKTKWFVKGDWDGLVGLFIDNLLQIMVLVYLLKTFCGFPDHAIFTRVLPGLSFSVLAGNLFYAWQAKKLMEKTGRDDVTALPYGINTPTVFAFVFFIMMPVYAETKNWEMAWYAGLFACFASGVLEFLGSFVGDFIRKATPRVALLAPLAGIAITFISMDFIFQIFSAPLIAIIPAILILIAYGARIKFPFSIPGGLLAVLIGTALAWGLYYFKFGGFTPQLYSGELGVYMPEVTIVGLFNYIAESNWQSFMAVIIPMAIFNIVGSFQNLESAAVAGDEYDTKPAMMMNGIGSIIASFLGSTFPTTIYIGHPAWKKMGAGIGYSIANGIIISLLCLFGGITILLYIVPIQATLGILLWIGILMCALCFQEIKKTHMLAAAFGLIPCLAAWALLIIQNTAVAGDVSIGTIIDKLKITKTISIHGLISLSQGALLVSMIFAAVMAYIVDKKFKGASLWFLVAAVFSTTGIIHAYSYNQFAINNSLGLFKAPQFTIVYLALAVIMLLLHLWLKKTNQLETTDE